jgi:hypothetical protein
MVRAGDRGPGGESCRGLVFVGASARLWGAGFSLRTAGSGPPTLWAAIVARIGSFGDNSALLLSDSMEFVATDGGPHQHSKPPGRSGLQAVPTIAPPKGKPRDSCLRVPLAEGDVGDGTYTDSGAAKSTGSGRARSTAPVR